MGDAGEGLIDAEARVAERMDEWAQERAQRRQPLKPIDADRVRQLESLRLARVELNWQLTATTHEVRRQQIAQALEEIDRQLVALGGGK